MKRRIAVILLAFNLVAGAIACGDSPVTPRSQCEDGSTRAKHKDGRVTYEKCSNGEWIKVQCLDGATKTSRGHHYTCRQNEWRRD